jgi:hypothetical protein
MLTVGVIAAKYFQNHHERALCVMSRLGYVQALSVWRFNRRLHARREGLYGMVSLVAEIYIQGEVFSIDSMPLPVCKRARASRCKKVRGQAFCGSCAAQKEKFFGWRLHLIGSPDGIPVSFDLLPAAEQDLTPIHELTVVWPEGATVCGDKAYVSDPDANTILAATGVRFVAVRRRNMSPNAWADEYDWRLYRKRIETVYSQLQAMAVQQLHARTNSGFDLKAWASLLALAFTNIIHV